jgi:hypothetical protein
MMVQKQFIITARNDGENWSSVASDSIILDRTLPLFGSFSPSNSSIIANAATSISVLINDAESGINGSSLVMGLDGANVSASYNSGSGSFSYTQASGRLPFHDPLHTNPLPDHNLSLLSSKTKKAVRGISSTASRRRSRCS